MGDLEEVVGSKHICSIEKRAMAVAVVDDIYPQRRLRLNIHRYTARPQHGPTKPWQKQREKQKEENSKTPSSPLTAGAGLSQQGRMS